MPAQAHDSVGFDILLEEADEGLRDSEGAPVAWPLALAADKGFRADWIDQYLGELQIKPVIPSKSNETPKARRLAFDRETYRDRNIIERLVGWLKESRRILTRFEKKAANYAGMVTMGIITWYLRQYG